MSKAIVATTDQRKASNPDDSVWVMANAGSGKTHVLIDRVIRLLLSGSDPQSIMCLTYTKAAAAEMSSRLFAKLSGWVGLDDEALRQALMNIGADTSEATTLSNARQLFARAIETPGGLKIQTIHAFCEKVLHLFPVESGLAPGFRVMDDEQKTTLLEQALDQTLNHAGVTDDQETLQLFDEGLLGNRDMFDQLAKAFLGGTSKFHHVLNPELSLRDVETALRGLLGLDTNVNTQAIVAQFRLINRSEFAKAAAAFQNNHDGSVRTTNLIADLLAVAATTREEDLIQAFEDMFFIQAGTVIKTLIVKPAIKAHPDTSAWLLQQMATITELLEQLSLSRKVDATVALIAVLRQVNQRFVGLKQNRGLYDFDDLILRMRALVKTKRAAQWVLYKLDSGLSHILVDESQDTSPTQWDIIRSLADEFFSGESVPRNRARTLFAVGDIKQSIYSFQGADTGAFLRAKDYFSETAGDVGIELKPVNLTVSYRSVEAVLDAVDAVFSGTSAASQGLGEKGRDTGHSTTRANVPGIVEFWPLLEPIDDTEDENWKAAVDHPKRNAPIQRLAQYVASQVKSWIGKRQLAGGHKTRTVQAGDILVLLQKRGPLFSALIAAFRQHGVAVAGADRLKLKESLAVQDILALLQVISLPEDDLTLACVLKSPLVPQPVTEEQLLRLAHGRATNLWSCMMESADLINNATVLKNDADFAREHGPYDVISRVLSRSRKALVSRLGVEALDATDMLLDQALDFEAQEGRSIAGFVQWFSRRDTDIKRELDQAQDQVRIMTVHGAKGLEANIVIMPDAHTDVGSDKINLLQSPPQGEDTFILPLLNIATAVKPEILNSWKDTAKDLSIAERMRLLYVAMTRARDELYIGGIKQGTAENSKSLSKNSWYQQILDSLDQSAGRLTFRSVEAGHPEGPVLRHGAEPIWLENPVAQNTVPKPDLPEWLLQALDSKEPTADIYTGRDGGVELVDHQAVQRGQAIHKFLERLTPNDSASLLSARAKRLKLDTDLAARLSSLATAPETSALFSNAAQAEARIMGYLPNGQKVDRRVDRLLVTADHIIVLDFKSERHPPAVVPDKYIRQITEYVMVLREAYPNHTVKAAILWTETAELIWLEMP